MGYLSSLLFAYLLGGVTFIPLVILAVLAHAHYTFPYREDGASAIADKSAPTSGGSSHDEDGIVQPGDDTSALDAARESKTRARHHSGGLDVASGYFAVCREYTPMGVNAKPIERSTPVGSATVAAPSPSVYQTMYRSIFERKAANGPLDSNGLSQRPKKSGNVFYVVLRHGHLMLFDDDEQLEVRHVISLAHHDISIYSGGDVTPEGELFIKRNALCLTRKESSFHSTLDSVESKPFYLFSENCSTKEDFYFALLKNQQQTFGSDNAAPKPQNFDVKNIISLVQRLHSNEEHVHTRWLNAMIGRIFLGLYQTKDLESFIREKITKKISRVKRPSFLTGIALRHIDTGDAAPFFTNLKLKDLTVEGECLMEADVKYTGNFRGEIAATATIDLGPRFKVREVNMVLAVVLKRLEGHVLFKVKPPPSNRIWCSFQTMPKMEMSIEPIVSTRQITYTVILRQIEHRIKEVFAETLVQPFWDDAPFFRTEHKKWRGGIFEGDDAVIPSQTTEGAVAQTGDVNNVDRLEDPQGTLNETRPIEKSHSLPLIDPQPAGAGILGRKGQRNKTNVSASASSTSVDTKGSTGTSTAQSPKIVKGNTNPVVGTDEAHADVFKPSSSPPDGASTFMAALQSRSQEVSPGTTPQGSPPKSSSLARELSHSSSSSSKNISEGNKDDEDESASQTTGRRDTITSIASGHSAESTEPQGASSPTRSLTKGQLGAVGRGLFGRRQNSNTSLATAASGTSESSQKRNTLAAVGNAAIQARNWGWNAIQKQKEARKKDEQAGQVDLTQPMGRGQPLPPPGTPLPRPANGSTVIKPVQVPKRKPVPDSALAERSNPDAAEGKSEDRSATRPPPLPQRRRRINSQDQPDDDAGENMLVVAVPDDSEPGTPASEDTPDYSAEWVDDGDDEDETQQSDGQAPTLPQPGTEDVEPSIDPLPADAGMQPEDAVVAAPAATENTTVDDDDGYAGWMDSDDADTANNDTPPLTAAVGTPNPEKTSTS